MSITKEALTLVSALPAKEKAALKAALKKTKKVSIKTFNKLSPLGKAAAITAGIAVIGLGVYAGLKAKDYMSYRQHKAQAH